MRWAVIMLALLPPPVFAQTIPNDPMVRYRALTSVAPKPCALASGRDEIVVCAANKLRESQKVPFIEELRMGDRPRRVLGELPGQDPGPPCPPRGCGCPPSECGIVAVISKILGN